MTTSSAPLPSYSIFHDEDPFPFFESLREHGVAVWDEGMRAWLFTGYEECAYIQRHEDVFLAPWPRADFKKIFGHRSPFMIEGESHRLLYNKIAAFFTKSVVDDIRVRFIRPLIESRLDRIGPRGEAELATEYAQEVPVRVIGSLLGLPWEDEELGANVWDWTTGFVRHTGRWLLADGGKDTQAAAEESMARLDEILLPHVRARGGGDPSSYIARLWEFGPSIFEDWGEEDVLSNCRFLFLAGVHTTTESISSAIQLLATNPDLQTSLRADRTLVTAFVEEALRLHPSLQVRVRIAGKDVELAGVQMREGDKVCTITAAANRDPGHFHHPSEVDLERQPASDHLTFNRGPRACAGAPLARAELWESINGLLERLDRIELNETKQPPVYEGFAQRGFRPLHVTFTERP